MPRTYVYLGKEELALLDEAARATGASRSAFIRPAVRRTFGPLSMAEEVARLQPLIARFRKA
jgi:uncharacterized protein (DUF1778 family)